MSCITAYVFNNRQVTVLFDDENNPWFKAKEVARILEYIEPKKAIRDHVRAKHKIHYKNFKRGETPLLSNMHSQTVLINEPGLYSLVMKSKMKLTEQFQDWVTEKVLPSIRKQGEYKLVNENTLLKNENIHLTRLFVNSTENNRQLTNMKKQLEAENKSMNQLLRDQVSKVAVFPNDDELKHVFSVLVKDSLLQEYGVCEYKCIRIEKRSFNQALSKAKKEGFQMCFMIENVPNGINILNKAKEIMDSYNMHYNSAYNNILTSYNFVNIVKHVINESSTDTI